MAITKKGGPQDFTPVYNPVNYYFDSDNKLKPGFRYVFDLYKSGVAAKISETRGAPRPVDGFGEAKIFNLLSPLVTRKFDSNNLDVTDAEENYIRYDLKVGEEFNEKWEYDDYEFYVDPGGTYNAFTKLRNFAAIPANAHTFIVGDQINVAQTDGGLLKPILEGLHTIVEIIDDWTIVIEIPFSSVGVGVSVGGSIEYSDGRKTITRDLFTASGVAFNGAFKVPDFQGLNTNNYELTILSDKKKLLTTVPDSFKISELSDIWLNFGQADTAGIAFYAYFENSNGDIFRKPIEDATKYIRQYYAGVDDSALTLVAGVAGLVKVDTEYYETWTANAAGVQSSKKYRFMIDSRCTIEDFEILFEDRLGSFIPFQFQLRTEKATIVKRTEYQKELGDLNTVSAKWEHKSYEAGLTTSNVEVDEEYLVRTNWMNRAEAIYYEEFISSPTHIVKIDGVYLDCSLITLRETTQGEGTSRLIRKELTFKLSNQNPVNV